MKAVTAQNPKDAAQMGQLVSQLKTFATDNLTVKIEAMSKMSTVVSFKVKFNSNTRLKGSTFFCPDMNFVESSESSTDQFRLLITRFVSV